MKKCYLIAMLCLVSWQVLAQSVNEPISIRPIDDGIGKKVPILIDPELPGGPGGPGGPVLQGRFQDAGDPNLDPNWDWTAASPVTMYYSPNGSTPTPLYNRFVPFWTSGNPLAADKDMYPEDGWQLVWKDFGTVDDAPANPFFVLYNKYRGTMRFMIYNANNDAYTLYKGELSFRADSPKNPLFTHTAEEKVFVYDFDAAQEEVYMGTGAKYNDWITLDFVTYGYKDNMNSNMILHLEVHGVDDSQISLQGNISLEEQLKKGSRGGSKGGVEGVVDAFKKGHSYYKSINDFRNDLEKTGKDEDNKDFWWAQPILNIATSQIASALPVVGSVVGFISSFIGGKSKAAPREPMKFLGEMELTGNIVNEQLILRDDFKTSPGGFSPDYYTSVQAIDWGVWSAAFKPRVLITRFEECRENWYGDYIQCYNSHAEITMAQPVIPYDFNSDLGMSIINKEAAYVYNHKEGTDYLPWNTFFNRVYTEGYYTKPSGISVKLTYRINNPVVNSDTELIMVKTLPIDIGIVYDCEGDCYGYRKGLELTTEELAAERLTTYPNPASSLLTLNIPMQEAGVVQLMLFDVQGRQLHSEQRNLGRGISEWQLDLNTSTLNSLDNGVYYLSVQTPDREWKQEVMINR